MDTPQKGNEYLGYLYLFLFVVACIVAWVNRDTSGEVAARANRQWANELMNRPTGQQQTFTWRDRNGNTTMQGKFTPDKPGSKSGRIEMRDAYGNRQGEFRVRP